MELSNCPKSSPRSMISHSIRSGVGLLGMPSALRKLTTSCFPTGTSTDQKSLPVRVSFSVTVYGCHEVLT